MQKTATENLTLHPRVSESVRNAGLVIGASLFVALCAHVTIPLPFTPVPLTLQNFGVLVVGLLLGSKRGFAAMVLYIAEGAVGLHVFNPMGRGSLAQVIGPTGGYLMAYPLVAGLAGWLFERGKATFAKAVLAGVAAEVLLFACGISWLFVLTHSLAQAMRFGLFAFVFAEVLKVAAAASTAVGLKRPRNSQA